jgi:hypothetical protein
MKTLGRGHLLPSVEFPLEATEDLVEGRMVGMDPVARAVAKALIDARMNPGSLVKITCADSDEAVKACHVLSHVVVASGLHKEGEMIGHDRDDWPIIELRNRSGVMVVIEWKDSKDG